MSLALHAARAGFVRTPVPVIAVALALLLGASPARAIVTLYDNFADFQTAENGGVAGSVFTESFFPGRLELFLADEFTAPVPPTNQVSCVPTSGG